MLRATLPKRAGRASCSGSSPTLRRRRPGGTRLYSDNDLERLRLIQRLTTELGLNLAGVEQVLRLEDEMRRLRARMDRLESELRDEIRAVHKTYKRELVLYRSSPHPAPRPGA